MLTSHFDEKTRVVDVDVYDKAGTFSGSFGLPMPDGFDLFVMSWTPMNIHNDSFYIFLNDEGGNRVLLVFTMKKLPAFA